MVLTNSPVILPIETYISENSCSLQFWKCNAVEVGDPEVEDPDDNRCTLTLTDLFCVSNIHDNRLEDYRRRCFNNNNNRLVGRETKVGDWFAGRATQTGVADYQYDGEASGMAQLVVPVYFNDPGPGLKLLAGIIELVTTQPNESYAEDFNLIQSLLMLMNLTSTYLGKTIKVIYKDMVRFTLPFSAKLEDLQKEVTMRFKKLENTTFCIKYEDTNLNHHSISNDQDLQFCIRESILNKRTFIKMHVEQQRGTQEDP